jgi:hypothetical protein
LVFKVTPKVSAAGSVAYSAAKAYRYAFAEDFAAQTSPAVNDEINRRYHPKTAQYIKQAWADVHFQQLAQAHGWQGADLVLSAAAIVDPTGIVGVLAAYVKPICLSIVPYPCTSIDLTCTV